MWDYGEEGNLARYGTKTPKTIDYSRIKTKFAIFGGSEDRIIKPKDIEVLIGQMPKESVVF